MPSTKRSLAAFLVIIACGWIFQAQPTLAADRYWVGGSGDWSDPANWSATAGGPGGAGAPADYSNAFLTASDAVDRTVSYTGSSGLSPLISQLRVDATGAGRMSLSIDGGNFSPNQFYVGYNGVGHVVQHDGDVGTNHTLQLWVGSRSGSSGSYELSGGQLRSYTLSLGAEDATGTFIQTGGVHQITDGGGVRAGASNLYQLQGGQLSTPYLSLGGAFEQLGGEFHTDSLYLADTGHMTWSAGLLEIRHGWTLNGRFTFPTAPAALEINGIVSFGQPTLTNAGNVAVNLGPQSLLIVDPGYDPGSEFAAFTNQGITHVRGSDVVIPAGKTVLGAGYLEEPAIVHGTLQAPIGSRLGVNAPIQVRSGGVVDLQRGTLSVRNGQMSAVDNGGILSAYGVTVSSSSDTASFYQAGGTVTLEYLTLTTMTGSSIYTLDDGELNITSSMRVSTSQPADWHVSARFVQNGGQVTARDLSLDGGTGSAEYTLVGGSLDARQLNIGVYSKSGGTLHISSPSAQLTVDTLWLGQSAEITAVPGAQMHLHTQFVNRSVDPTLLEDLSNLCLIVEGVLVEKAGIEVAGLDLGAVLAGYDSNFAFDTLQIGGDAGIGRAHLTDFFDNSLANGLPEALYVEHLVLGTGSTLDLNGLNLYYQTFTDLGGTVNLNGGQLVLVPEPAAIVGLVGLCLLRGRRR